MVKWSNAAFQEFKEIAQREGYKFENKTKERDVAQVLLDLGEAALRKRK